MQPTAGQQPCAHVGRMEGSPSSRPDRLRPRLPAAELGAHAYLTVDTVRKYGSSPGQAAARIRATASVVHVTLGQMSAERCVWGGEALNPVLANRRP